MTGAPAETWRKFRFSTSPAWVYVLFVIVCALGVIGVIVVAIIQSAVSRRASGYLPLTRAASRKVAFATWLPIGLIIGAAGMGAGAFVVGGLGSGSGSSGHVNSALVYTTWVADANVTDGPEPGYKPVLTGLTGDHVTSVSAVQESGGGLWDLDLSFDATGTQLISDLTRANIAACPGDSNTDPSAMCAQRSLALWVGLTQSDIDNWENQFYAAGVSRSLGAGCQALASPGTACAKLVINAITQGEIDGGEAAISGFSQQEAQGFVAAIQPQSTSTDSVASAFELGLGGLAVFTLVVGLVGALVLRRLIGPRATVMEQPPGYNDKLVELRNVNQVFAASTLQINQARSAQYSSMQAPAGPALPPGSN